jgi:hypothetical protein
MFTCDLSNCGLISDSDVNSNSSDSSETSGCDICWYPRSKCQYLFDCICGKTKCSHCRCSLCDIEMLGQLKSIDQYDISKFLEITNWANHTFKQRNIQHKCTLEMTIFVSIQIAIYDYSTGGQSIQLPWKNFSFSGTDSSNKFLEFIENMQSPYWNWDDDYSYIYRDPEKHSTKKMTIKDVIKIWKENTCQASGYEQ